MGGEFRPSIGCVPVRFLGRVNFPSPGGQQPWRVTHSIPEHSRDFAMVIEPLLQIGTSLETHRGRPIRTARGQSEVELEFDLEKIPPGEQVLLRPHGHIIEPAPDAQSTPLRIPEEATLAFGLGVRHITGLPAKGRVRFRVDVVRRFSGSVTIFDETVEVRRLAEEWQDRTVPLRGLAGETVRFRFRSDAENTDSAIPLWGAAQLLAVPPQTVGRPNFVLISLDTLRADMIDAVIGGEPVMPFLASLDQGWVRFTDTSTAFPSTTASHMSLFTGLLPSVHRVDFPSRQLPREIPTLAERLAEAGWQTLASTENGMIATESGHARGFAFYRESKGSGYSANVSGAARQTFERGLSLLRRHPGERFFLFLHTYDVHTPYHRPDGHDLFREQGPEVPPDRIPEKNYPDFSAYAAEAHATDGYVRDLLASLESAGLMDNTVVIITSDHGEAFGENGTVGHLFLNDPVMRVPLLVHLPDSQGSKRQLEAPTSLLDLAPTVLELAGLPPLAVQNGHSLGAWLAGRTVENWPAARLGETALDGPHAAMVVRLQNRKLVAFRDPEKPAEEFDLLRDPLERSPIRSQAAALEAVRWQATWAEQVRRSRAALGLDAIDGPKTTGEVDAERMKKLRALGYVE